MVARRRGKQAGAGRRSRLGEREAIDLLGRRLRAHASSEVVVGMGDDAAVLQPRSGQLVWTVDVCVEGVHFQRDWLSWADVGWRSMQAAVSDLAAMGARPVSAVSSLIVPRSIQRRQLDQLGAGQAEASHALRCPVVGGNIAAGAELSVTVSALGRAERPLLRTGALVEDELWVVGDVGLAAAGLAILMQRGAAGRRKWMATAAAERCLRAWRRPAALVGRGARLAQRAHAAIDVSDGLGGDASRLAEASGVRLVIEQAPLRRALRPELVEVCRHLGTDPVQLAVRGGEDYALLATGPSRNRPRWARRIGRVEAGRGSWLEAGPGTTQPLDESFEHVLG